MLIIGCDYHPGFQQIVFVDTDTGECGERRLAHHEEAEQFYRELKQQGMQVRVGMEASGHARWFERLLSELNFELWIGDAAEIRTKRVRKQKTDRQDAQLLLRLSCSRWPLVNWRNIAISLIDPQKGDQTAHAGVMACFRQSSFSRYHLAVGLSVDHAHYHSITK